MSAPRDLRRRFMRGAAAFLIAGSVAAPGLASAQQEAPTAETEIIVNVESAGTFDVGWTSNEITFLTDDGSSPTLNAEQTSVHVSATFSITVNDQRPPGQTKDEPYTLILQCPDLVSDGGETIPASALTVEEVVGMPAPAVGPVTAGATCSNSLVIYSMPAKSGKMTATIDLVIGTTLSVNTAAGTYGGTFILQLTSGTP